jgi:hypothetical protein
MDHKIDQIPPTDNQRPIGEDRSYSTVVLGSVPQKSHPTHLSHEQIPKNSTLITESSHTEGSYPMPNQHTENRVNEEAKRPSMSRVSVQEETTTQRAGCIRERWKRAVEAGEMWPRLVYNLVGILLVGVWVGVT